MCNMDGYVYILCLVLAVGKLLSVDSSEMRCRPTPSSRVKGHEPLSRASVKGIVHPKMKILCA